MLPLTTWLQTCPFTSLRQWDWQVKNLQIPPPHPTQAPRHPAPGDAAQGRGCALAAVFLLISHSFAGALCVSLPCPSLSFQLCSALFIIIITIIISASADGPFGSFNIYLQEVLPS